jgi:hypothetical protein
VVTLQVALGIARVTELIEVIAPSSEPMMRTTQVATAFTQDLLSALPTTRDLNAALLMSSAVHPTGPNGFYSISGATSAENLFLINGVTVNENLRGQPHDLYIEDAVEVTTIATAGIPAEYGRFGGGVVNVVTKSGGNDLAGSFRTTLHNDKWRALTPFEDRAIANDPNRRDTRVGDLLPTYEYTLGGPVLRDRLWFFTAGRFQQQEAGRQTALTLTNYRFSDEQERYEAKGTASLGANHRLQAAFTKLLQDQTNSSSFSPTGAGLLDLRSLHDPSRRMDLLTLEYNSVLSPALFLEARVSARNETTKNQGAPTQDRVDGTLLVDQRGFRYWSPTFCGVCTPEERDNSDLFLKASYFRPTERWGSHDVVAGYDLFNDKRFANNHQSGSGYRVENTTAIIRGAGDTAEVYPQILGGTANITWSPIMMETQGSNFRTHSVFVSDRWRVSPRVTVGLGLRYDKNDGANSVEQVVADDSAWSPRLGVVFDPTGSNEWSVNGSFARYVAGLANSVADASSPGGNADNYQFRYNGPSINADPNGALVPANEALDQLFDWFFANGGPDLPLTRAPFIRGVTPLIRESLTSPNVWEWAGGANRQFGSRASIRADVVYRDFHDFYAFRTDTGTGQVLDRDGRAYDLTVITNSDDLTRRYAGLTLQGAYRARDHFDAGVSYTLARAWGNVEGEGAGGPTPSAALQYPEYKQASWNYPIDELSIDQRHRARVWATYRTPWVEGLSVSLLQIVESGVPYGAVSASGVNAGPFVTNPGYLSPPPGSQTVYYFTATDEFRTEGQRRTDVAANYQYRVPGAGRLELFGQVQVLNLFNQSQLCACGASTVSQNGGSASIANRIDTGIRTPVTHGALYQPFNPFTTAPVRGVNWDYGPSFGQALSRLAYTTPRTLRVTFGVRF